MQKLLVCPRRAPWLWESFGPPSLCNVQGPKISIYAYIYINTTYIYSIIYIYIIYTSKPGCGIEEQDVSNKPLTFKQTSQNPKGLVFLVLRTLDMPRLPRHRKRWFPNRFLRTSKPMYDQWIGFAGKILTGNHRFSKKNMGLYMM